MLLVEPEDVGEKNVEIVASLNTNPVQSSSFNYTLTLKLHECYKTKFSELVFPEVIYLLDPYGNPVCTSFVQPTDSVTEDSSRSEDCGPRSYTILDTTEEADYGDFA